MNAHFVWTVTLDGMNRNYGDKAPMVMVFHDRPTWKSVMVALKFLPDAWRPAVEMIANTVDTVPAEALDEMEAMIEPTTNDCQITTNLEKFDMRITVSRALVNA